jgi:hypothetical protein
MQLTRTIMDTNKKYVLNYTAFVVIQRAVYASVPQISGLAGSVGLHGRSILTSTDSCDFDSMSQDRLIQSERLQQVVAPQHLVVFALLPLSG